MRLSPLAVYGSIALVVSRRLPRRRDRILLLAATGLLVLAIGFSRLYLGVHFLSDVLAGYAAGIAWLASLYVVSRCGPAGTPSGDAVEVLGREHQPEFALRGAKVCRPW